MIPYGKQWVDQEDAQAVVKALGSERLTTGPAVAAFEEAVAKAVGAKHGVAVSSGTAALHAALYAGGIGPGDEVIVPPMTFVATANAVVFQGGTPIFSDVEPDTLLLDPRALGAQITPRTKAVMPVDYGGQPCRYDELRAFAEQHHLLLIADACHSLGAAYRGRAVGTLADLTVFSFHPVKPITTGEGGMVVTDDAVLAQRMRMFRNHCMTADASERERHGSWFYEVTDLGYNYRLTDVQSALGVSQLRKLSRFIQRRREIAQRYDEAFAGLPMVQPLRVRPDVRHGYHLYVVQLSLEELGRTRADLFAQLREKGIGVNVHYIPVHLHPFYRQRFGTHRGQCPVAEAAYERILSVPIFSAMTDQDVEDVISAVRDVISASVVR